MNQLNNCFKINYLTDSNPINYKRYKRTYNESEAVSSIPTLVQGQSILFAKEKMNEISIEGQSFDVKYEGNNIIGDGRTYVDMFLIVDDTDWPSIKGKEKNLLSWNTKVIQAKNE